MINLKSTIWCPDAFNKKELYQEHHFLSFFCSRTAKTRFCAALPHVQKQSRRTRRNIAGIIMLNTALIMKDSRKFTLNLDRNMWNKSCHRHPWFLSYHSVPYLLPSEISLKTHLTYQKIRRRFTFFYSGSSVKASHIFELLDVFPECQIFDSVILLEKISVMLHQLSTIVSYVKCTNCTSRKIKEY